MKMPTSFLPYAKQSISDADLKAVHDALKGEVITRGAEVTNFENAVAETCGAQYAVAFSSGTAALMATFFAAELTPYDRVISSPNTFIATVGSALQMGIKPRLIDIDLNTGNMDLELLKEELKAQSTRGRPFIVPVHFSGIAVDMQAFDSLINHPDAVVIEDAAHALGSYYPSGEKVGSCVYSQMTIFSFHPAKTITTGEGGMVTTNDEKLYHRLQLFRDNGIERWAPFLKKPSALGYYEVQAVTGNFNFTSFQAALGLSQFSRLEEFIAKRHSLVKHYRQLLKGMEHIRLLADDFDDHTAFHLFVVQIDFASYKTSRDQVMRTLKERGVGTQVHYIPLYRHPALQIPDDEYHLTFPAMETYYSQTLTLPLYFDLTIEEVEKVCRELKNVLKG
jgi:UDP-4-amino-4,6-dideoxy-L-N-acetyl-beta-L-altrosamine transaminase